MRAIQRRETIGSASIWEKWWRAGAALDALDGVGRDWREVPVPMRDWKTWGVPELPEHDGMVWFRRSVTLTAAAGRGARRR